MKKNICIYFLLAFFLLMSCASNKYSIENAVSTAVNEIQIRTKQNDTIAVLSVSSISDNLSNQIITWLENYLVNNANCKIVSRQKIDSILTELNFGLSGYTSDESLQSIGKFLGANYILVGDIKTIDNITYLNIQTLETETAKLIYSNSFIIKYTKKNVRQTVDPKERKKTYRF